MGAHVPDRALRGWSGIWMMSKPPGSCAYCGKIGKRSEEHIWGRWLSKLFADRPTRTRKTAHLVTSQRDGNVIRMGRGPLDRQGHFRNQQLRIVCTICNNGWMREVNEAAAPIIRRMIDHGPYRLSSEEKLAFSNWVTMFSMSYELADRETMATPISERRFLMENRHPPDGWWIMVGLYWGTAWSEMINHRGAWIGEDSSTEDLKCNAQTTVFTLGRSAVISISGSVPIEYILDLIKIYPVQVTHYSDSGFELCSYVGSLSDKSLEKLATFGQGFTIYGPIARPIQIG